MRGVAGLIAAVAAAGGIIAAGVGAAQGDSSSAPPLRAWGFGAGRSTAAEPHITRARQIRPRAHDCVATGVDDDPAGTKPGRLHHR